MHVRFLTASDRKHLEYFVAQKIHVSSETAEALESFGSFDLSPRGEIDIKVRRVFSRRSQSSVQGKGLMTTFWLQGETSPALCTDKDYNVMNQDEGIDDDDIEEITFTFHVSEPTNQPETGNQET